MPAKGVSLHIGLNLVDPVHYQGWDGALAACEFDANDLQALAIKQGFQTTKLLTPQATAANVIAAIKNATSTLKSGDLFLLTYSGHGGQIPDLTNEETDGQDETWVLHDRELIDDELYQLFGLFKSGVRVFVLSDSCHSGSVTRALPREQPPLPPLGGPRPRLLPPDVARRTYRAHQKTYDAIQKAAGSSELTRPRAAVLLVSGCQDNQTSADGARNGLFTENLRRIWANGKFSGGHRLFRDKIAGRLPPYQSPNFYKVGTINPAFENQKPFTI